MGYLLSGNKNRKMKQNGIGDKMNGNTPLKSLARVSKHFNGVREGYYDSRRLIRE